MKSLLSFPLRLLAFWLLFFAAFRLWFVLWFQNEWTDEKPTQVWWAFWHALPLDLSMAAYLMMIPVLLWFAAIAVGKRYFDFFESAITSFNVLIFSALVFVFGANVFVYEEWHTLLNNRALEYFKTPSALLDSMSFIFKLVSVLLFFSGVWLFYKSYKKLLGSRVLPENPNRLALLALPLFVGFLFLLIRGGLGVMPINESAVYYSPNIFDNHAATNTAWHLAHSKLETRSTENHFTYMAAGEAKNLVNTLLEQNVDETHVAPDFFDMPESGKLNVVFIIMESHTAQLIEALGAEPGLSPNLDKLAANGLLFTNCYSSGYRTDQGIVSVLAGYPAQPDQSIVLLEDKAVKLNSVPSILHRNGYSTAYFHGGELTFANIGSWLSQQNFEKLISEHDFKSQEKTQRWGVDDHIMLQRAVFELNAMREPFFAAAMTLSLHPPFDVPHQSRWTGSSEKEKFLNSAEFADKAIGDFFTSAKSQSWYDHTVFVLVADHGASPPNMLGGDNPGSRQVPWIIYGEPLKENWRGVQVNTICNHHDIPSTVLAMLGVHTEADDFPWSSNQMPVTQGTASDSSGFAFFTNENGLGWVNQDGKGFYYFQDEKWHFWRGQLDSIDQQSAKAYLQVLYDDFLSK
ncbi:MAG: sulfatase-like hydrolase/transferase [Lewinellaceae bacterium]|nr:sulfatase-like hydrolase/transferase [Saprospiraceae bacterium]MCB9344051.1 sulfatase-like hydrolase/transferase [Lewinellaceae bacterium]